MEDGQDGPLQLNLFKRKLFLTFKESHVHVLCGNLIYFSILSFSFNAVSLQFDIRIEIRDCRGRPLQLISMDLF